MPLSLGAQGPRGMCDSSDRVPRRTRASLPSNEGGFLIRFVFQILGWGRLLSASLNASSTRQQEGTLPSNEGGFLIRLLFQGLKLRLILVLGGFSVLLRVEQQQQRL